MKTFILRVLLVVGAIVAGLTGVYLILFSLQVFVPPIGIEPPFEFLNACLLVVLGSSGIFLGYTLASLFDKFMKEDTV